MSILQKPNLKSGINTTLNLLSVGAGVKVADMATAVAPDSWKPWKNWALFGLALLGATAIDTKKPGGDKAQLFLLGLAGKPLYNELTGIATEHIAAQDSSTFAGKAINALVGHRDLDSKDDALGYQLEWPTNDEGEPQWDRLQAEEIPFTVSGV